VAYVDNDLMVAHEARALLESAGPGIAVVDADLADLATVTGHPAFGGVIDLAEPVCLIFGLVLNLFPAAKAREIMAPTRTWSRRAAMWCSRAGAATTRCCGSSSARPTPPPTSTTTRQPR
jgi:hypothetical protein